MTTSTFLAEATKTLAAADVPTARLDCLVLLEDVTGKDRAVLLAHPETTLTPQQVTKLNGMIKRREEHVPIAYIRGKAAFYGRDFLVDEHVLVPRPESETMIDMLKQLPLPPHPLIADIGTGSGCLGITATLEVPGAKALLYDIDPQALTVARQNIAKLHATASCRQNDLLNDRPDADVILANLPYVPDRYAVNQAALHEPKLAIFAGKDGLNLYRRFWEQAATLPQKPAFILTESLPPQHDDLVAIAKGAGYRMVDAQDFIQLFMPNL